MKCLWVNQQLYSKISGGVRGKVHYDNPVSRRQKPGRKWIGANQLAMLPFSCQVKLVEGGKNFKRIWATAAVCMSKPPRVKQNCQSETKSLSEWQIKLIFLFYPIKGCGPVPAGPRRIKLWTGREDRIRSICLKLQQQQFRLNIGKTFLTARVVKQWNRFLREIVESFSLEVFSSGLYKHLIHIV